MAVQGIPQDMNIFEWMFQLGIGLEGDPNYYASGEATEAEFSNLFSIATQEINKLDSSNPVRKQYYEFLKDAGAYQGDPTYYSTGKAAPEEFTNLVNVTSDFFANNPDAGETTSSQPTVSQPGVMPGGQTIKVGDQWYQSYEFPAGSGNFMVFQFNNQDQVVETFGEVPPYQTRDLNWLNKQAIVQASAEEVIGQTTSFQRYTQTLMQDAAAAAGVRDPSLIGRIANNPEMQQILAQAVAGDWEPAQVLAEQRKTNFWKNELYPGIEQFYSMSDNPEADYREYQATVEPSLEALGYERGADGTYKSQIKRMLDNQIDASTFISQVPTYIRATQNAEFAGVLDQWAERELGRNIDFNDWFDLMAGQSQPELDDIAERAMLAYEAQNRGTDVSDTQIEQLAARSQLTQQEAIAAFSNFNQAVLATEGFRRSDITQDDVLAAMAGINPQSGRSIDEVRLEVAKLAREEAIMDDEKINFYVGFDPSGKPTRPGLQSLAPEGA